MNDSGRTGWNFYIKLQQRKVHNICLSPSEEAAFLPVAKSTTFFYFPSKYFIWLWVISRSNSRVDANILLTCYLRAPPLFVPFILCYWRWSMVNGENPCSNVAAVTVVVCCWLESQETGFLRRRLSIRHKPAIGSSSSHLALLFSFLLCCHNISSSRTM